MLAHPLNRRRRNVAAVLVALLIAPSARGGEVLPPDATPNGWSIDGMAAAVANFSSSGNDLAYYPTTPFQILYRKSSAEDPSGTNTFHVSPGTPLYVKFFFIDNAPPVIGTWPVDKAAAAAYIFADEQLGADFEIDVDGVPYSLNDPGYVGGPVVTPEAPGGGSELIQVGAFISPLAEGAHVITARGSIDGTAFVDFVGGPFNSTLTYHVVVGAVPEPTAMGLVGLGTLVLGAVRRKWPASR